MKTESNPALADLSRLGLGAAAWSGAAALGTITALAQEMTRFLTDRFAADLALQNDLLACRDPASLQEVQMRFVTDAMADYVAAAARMAQLGVGVAAATSHHRAKDNGPI